MNILLLASFVINILTCGAVGDSSTVSTRAIQTAIDAAASHGGGEVVVPRGTYLTGTLRMKSGVTLRLQKGAVLKGSERLADYESFVPTADLSRYESGRGTQNANSAYDTTWTKAMIVFDHCHDAGIEGRGIIDGNNVRNPQGEEHMRGPHTIICANSSDMDFKDFTIRNAANYAFLGYELEDTELKNLSFIGGWDGIHIRGGKNIDIERCTFRTGDDAIAGGYWRDMTISHCDINSSCNGIRMIQPSVGLRVEHCHFFGPGINRHITSGKTCSDAAISLEPGGWGPAPGRMDSIYISNVEIESVLTPLSVTLGKDNTCGEIVVDRMKARDITRMALSVKSWVGSRTEHAVIRNSDLQFRGIDDPALPAWFEGKSTDKWPVFPSWGMYFRNVGRVDIHNVKLSTIGKDYRKDVIKE